MTGQGKGGRVDYLLPGDSDDIIHFDFVPMKRQRVHNGEFDLAEVEFKGVSARGRRLSPKPVAKMKKLKRDAEEQVAEVHPIGLQALLAIQAVYLQGPLLNEIET